MLLCSQLSSTNAAKQSIFAPTKPQLLGERGGCTWGPSLLFPRQSLLGPEHSSARAEGASPPQQACQSLGEDCGDSDLPRDLDAPKQIPMVPVPAGLGC